MNAEPKPGHTKQPFRFGQVRWAEPLGNKACPYAYRWTLNLHWLSFRIHHWITTEDSRYKHDHPWGFATIVLKGGYTDVSDTGKMRYRSDLQAEAPVIELDELSFLSLRYRPAAHRHYVDVNPGGCWTFLVTGPVVRNWGYWVQGKLKRPLRYFGKWGHPICGDN